MGKVTRNSAGLVKFEAACKEMENLDLKVGWFATARYPDGTPVAYVATIQEFGAASQGIPPRPFMRPTIVEKQKEWSSLMGRWSKAVVKNEMPAYDAMDLLGLAAAGDVRRTISDLTEPALSPLTIAARAYIKMEGRAPGSKLNGAKELGKVAGMMKAGTLDLSGVSTKPLVASTLMLGTLTSVVTRKTS